MCQSAADLTKNIAKLAGPAVMGVLVSQVGLGWVYALNAASFVVMALILASLRGADATLEGGPGTRAVHPARPWGSLALISSLRLTPRTCIGFRSHIDVFTMRDRL